MIDDYGGPFDPGIGLASFSRRALASIGREYMLFGHLLNRASLPWVHVKLGGEAREAVAIEEWMGASPVYTRRMQRALGFAGDDVETILKGLQLDVGFAHQYMDVRYALEEPRRGSFWLPSCGALLEVEPYGEAAVFSMCHAIEDPTFDATAVATNPRARVRPVHRPPRVPADRTPHCEWQVFVVRAPRRGAAPCALRDGAGGEPACPVPRRAAAGRRALRLGGRRRPCRRARPRAARGRAGAQHGDGSLPLHAAAPRRLNRPTPARRGALRPPGFRDTSSVVRRVLKWVALGIVVVAVGLGAWVYRQLTRLTSERVTDDVHVIYGLGGNAGVLRTGEGTVVVDTMSLPLQGERIRALAEELTGEPVVAVVNTHYHSDHTHGNPGFAEHVRIVSTARTRRHLLERDGSFWEDHEGYVPGETFDESAGAEHVLRLGGKTVRLVHPGRGHTDGDLVALFVEDGVVHMGDLLFAGRYPNIDLEAGGTIAAWPQTLDRVTELDFERVIPGHGPVTDREGIALFRGFLEELWAAGRTAQANGWSLDETLAKTSLTRDAHLEPFVIPFIVRLDRDFVVRRAFEEATGAVGPVPSPG